MSIMLENHPELTDAAVHEASLAYREGNHSPAKFLARREQDKGLDGRQVMITVQWLAGLKRVKGLNVPVKS